MMESQIVVISWWSNCLGLTCLHQLARHAGRRRISVVQVGKSPEGRARFREYLPPGVTELPYPEEAPAEHSQVIRDIALRHLRTEPGLWFWDHDVFIEEDCESWLAAADEWFGRSELCLCVHPSPTGLAITQPAFWMSPQRWPPKIRDVDPIPFVPRIESRRPDVFRNNGELRMPVKDTLVQAWETLAALGRASSFPVSGENSTELLPFPRHVHLGGLSLFAGPVLPPIFGDWMRATVERFTTFYDHCDWLATEDQELLRRLHEFQGAVYAG